MIVVVMQISSPLTLTYRELSLVIRLLMQLLMEEMVTLIEDICCNGGLDRR